MECDVLAGEHGPSCIKSLHQIPDFKLIYVRFIEKKREDADLDNDISDSELEGPYGGPVPKKSKAVSPQSESKEEIGKWSTMSAPSPGKERVHIRDKAYSKSLSVVSMMKLGKVIKESKNSVVEVSTFDMRSMSWSALLRPVEFNIEDNHFAQGGFRKAFKARSETHGFEGQTWVVKYYLPDSVKDIKATNQTVENHTKKVVQMHLLAKNFAEQMSNLIHDKDKNGAFGECFSFGSFHFSTVPPYGRENPRGEQSRQKWIWKQKSEWCVD